MLRYLGLHDDPRHPGQVMNEVVAAAESFDSRADVKAIIITGAGERAFAAGADIEEMASKDYAQVSRGTNAAVIIRQGSCLCYHVL